MTASANLPPTVPLVANRGRFRSPDSLEPQRPAATSWRRFVRARVHPLVVTSASPAEADSFQMGAEILWAAGLAELEEVLLWCRGSARRSPAVLKIGSPGEVRVGGALARLYLPGARLTLAAYGYVADGLVSRHEANLVLLGEGNHLIEIRRRRVRPVETEPSFRPVPPPVVTCVPTTPPAVDRLRG